MTPARPDVPLFWKIADQMIAERRAEEGTLMSSPCLRRPSAAEGKGRFFAMAGRRDGDVIVKLPRVRVDELIESGVGRPFAPAGRTFREWVSIPRERSRRWRGLLEEAWRFAGDD